MKTTSLLQSLTEKIQEACPELLELSFGCEIYRKGATKREIVCGRFANELALVRVDELGAWIPFTVPMPPLSQEFEVIGHPVHLEHIVRTIQDNCHPEYVYEMNIASLLCFEKYYPSKPFTEQSPELYQWLASVLNVTI